MGGEPALPPGLLFGFEEPLGSFYNACTVAVAHLFVFLAPHFGAPNLRGALPLSVVSIFG